MDNKISFAKSVKEEITSNNYDSMVRLKALLSAYIRVNSSIIFSRKETHLYIQTENAKIARFFYENIVKLYDAEAHIDYERQSNRNKHLLYCVTVSSKAEEIIEDLSVSFLEGKIPKDIVYDDDTISGYLAGAFLAGGSVNSPITSNYHLEISLNNENYAKWLSKLFSKYKNSNIEPKVIARRDKYIIYFKKGDQISQFLIMVGAVNAAMEFEEYRMSRDLFNSNNRLINIDTANMSKIVKAGHRQKEEILMIDKMLGIKNLKNQKAVLLANLRLANEQASLEDLANEMSETLNVQITKSNVNHLFRYMHEIYEKVKGGSK